VPRGKSFSPVLKTLRTYASKPLAPSSVVNYFCQPALAALTLLLLNNSVIDSSRMTDKKNNVVKPNHLQ
jgi:hypothetical protein